MKWKDQNAQDVNDVWMALGATIDFEVGQRPSVHPKYWRQKSVQWSGCTASCMEPKRSVPAVLR
jgi:UDP-N-acetyl-D-mannosaminuronic acid transferase (WecB/TagA/CpsF family)